MSVWKYLFFFVLASLAIGIVSSFVFFENNPSRVRVAFLDVGQGDSILITRGSNQILIDTGKNSRALLSELGRFLSPWDRTIEVVILTHHDQDHVGALPDLLSRYDVRVIFSTDIPDSTEMNRALKQVIDEYGVQVVTPSIGTSLRLGTEARLDIVFPDSSTRLDLKNTNSSSVVSLLSVGADTFLFTGDLPKEEMVLSAKDIHVLKVSHHGSKYSTSDVFLERMIPEEAIISVGKNSYGHPAQEVLDRLEKHEIKIFRTDIHGTIVYDCPSIPGSFCARVRFAL